MTEELRIWTNGYSNEELVGYEIVCWPECQMLMEIDGFREHSFQREQDCHDDMDM